MRSDSCFDPIAPGLGGELGITDIGIIQAELPARYARTEKGELRMHDFLPPPQRGIEEMHLEGRPLCMRRLRSCGGDTHGTPVDHEAK